MEACLSPSSQAVKAYELAENGLVTPEFRIVPIFNGLQLYDPEANPGESKNLAHQHPEKVATLTKRHTIWRAKMANTIKGKGRK